MQPVRRLPWRSALEWLVPVGAVAVAVVVAAVGGTRLPDPVATGWPQAGGAEGPSPRWLELSIGVVVVAIAAAFTWTASQVASVRSARWLVVFAHVTAVAWLCRLVRVVSANLDVTHWTEADARLSIPAMVVASVVAGGIGWAVSAHRQQGHPAR